MEDRVDSRCGMIRVVLQQMGGNLTKVFERWTSARSNWRRTKA